MHCNSFQSVALEHLLKLQLQSQFSDTVRTPLMFLKYYMFLKYSESDEKVLPSPALHVHMVLPLIIVTIAVMPLGICMWATISSSCAYIHTS